MDSRNYRRCSGTAIKLLVDLARQYRGNNNGDLAPALVRDGPAHQAKAKALRELVHYGLLVQTKHGGLGMPSLYAVTWQPIHHHKTRCLEVAATTTAPGHWKEVAPDFDESQKKPRLKISVAKADNQPFAI
jgi:hypothetical protein